MHAPLRWTFDPANPVIVPGQLNPPFDQKRTAGAFVVTVGSTYRMYYWATDDAKVNRICMAEAPVERPNEWRGIGCALEPQRDTEYNFLGPVCPAVLPRDDGPWLMYVGTNPRPAATGYPT